MEYDYVRMVDSYCDRHKKSDCKRYLELLCFPDDPRHGTSAAYGVGCRCPACTAAAVEKVKEKRRRNAERGHKARALGNGRARTLEGRKEEEGQVEPQG